MIEAPPPLGNLFQCSTALKLRFSLCLNANSYVSFHAHCLLSCEWANWGDVGFLFTPSHSIFINTGKTFKAKQSQLSCLSRTDASCLLYHLCNPLLPSLTHIHVFLTLGSCFAPDDISHESNRKSTLLIHLFNGIYMELTITIRKE